MKDIGDKFSAPIAGKGILTFTTSKKDKCKVRIKKVKIPKK